MHKRSTTVQLNNTPITTTIGYTAAQKTMATESKKTAENVSQASIVSRLRCGGTVSDDFIANFCQVSALLQPQDPARGTRFQFNYAIRTSPTDCSDNS